MSPLRSAGCLLAVTLLILTTEVRSAPNEKVKRGAPFQVSTVGFQTNERREATLTFNSESTGIILNHPNFEFVELDDMNDEINYISQTVVIRFEDGNTSSASDITRFSHVDPTRLYSEVMDGDVLTGAGFVFFQRPTALFVQDTAVSNLIFRILASGLPGILEIRFAQVLIVQRTTPSDNIVLNIDSAVEDGVANPSDDVIELSGSFTYIISEDQDMVYDGSNIIVFSGNTVQPPLGMGIANFYFLEPFLTPGTTIIGRSFEIFNNSNLPREVFSGPGILRVGMNAGLNVAFYSTVVGVNRLISEELVSQSLTFAGANGFATIVAAFPPNLRGQQLISLTGAQSFNFPSATSVHTRGSVVEVLSADQQIIQRFDLGQSPNFASFIGHEVRLTTDDEVYNIPDGGATLWINPTDNTFFLYPSRNQIIGGNITMAIANAGIETEVTTARFSLSSNSFGVVTLTLVTMDTPSMTFEIQVHPASVGDIQPGQSLSYKAKMLELIGSDGIPRRMYDMISPFIVNLQGSELLSADDTFFTTFGGPGRLYIDRNNSFYTTNVAVQNFITNFIQSLPQPVVNLVRESGTNDIYFRTGNQNLLRLNGGETFARDRAAIYFQNEINFVDIYDIPSNARARYNSATRQVVVSDPNNPGGNPLFESVPLGGEIDFFNDFSIPQLDRVPDLDADFNFPFMNGMIYHSGTGVLVSSSNFINEDIYNILFGSGGIDAAFETVMGVSSLTVADGSSVVTYRDEAPFVLPRDGTYYFSMGMPRNGFYFDTNSYMTFLQGVRRLYTQLNPTSVSYNRTTGVLSLLTGEGGEISTLSVGETVLTTIEQGISFLYANETIFFDDGRRRTGIDELLIWDGFQLRIIDRSVQDAQTLFGPGLFWFIDENTAFFTTDTSSVRRVEELTRNVMGTFRVPVLGQDPRTFRSKFRRVEGGFPQVITVYEGADVQLSCNVAATNPAATITFFERTFNETSGDTIIVDDPIEIGDPGFSFSQTGNVATLVVQNLGLQMATTGSRTFVCRAGNLIGARSLATVVNVLPAQPPAIVNNFVPPLSFFTRSSDRLETVTAGDINNMLAFNPEFFTIVGPDQAEGVEFFDDGTTVVRRIHIGCKAEGLPKSEITWFELADSTDTDLLSINRVRLNGSESTIDITVPREGRSVLSVTLNQAGPECSRYICSATNAAGTVLGAADICTQNYDCEGTTEQGNCSVTCGIGSAPRRYVECGLTRSGIVTTPDIEYEDIPAGLFPLPAVFCQDQPCPVVAFNFFRTNETNCSVTCGCGVIDFDVGCRRTVTVGDTVMETTIVADSFCAGQRRPRDQERCFNPPCPFYDVTPFSSCSATCRGGIRTRNVTCVRPMFNESSATMDPIEDSEGNFILEEVDQALCDDEGIRRPDDTVECNNHINCPFRYKVGNWSICSQDYIFCQTREILCENYDPNDYRWPGNCTDIRFCEENTDNMTIPHRIRSCGGGTCAIGVWEATTDGDCSVTCGRGQQRFNVICVNRTNGGEIDDYFCDPAVRPSEIQTCAVNCEDRCFFEPDFCPFVKQIGCARDNLRPLAIQCCRSCPKVATPPTDLPSPIGTGIGTVTAEP